MNYLPDGKFLDIIISVAIDHFKLYNNLPVIFVDMPEVPSAAIGFMVKIGQRDGGLAKAEISHVLEHLLFDGTKKLPKRTDIALAIDEIGAEFSGETGEEHTYYYLKSEPKNFQKAAFILSQMVVYPLLKDSELQKEKQIILQELDLREDEPIVKITDFLQETLFPNHPLGCSREAGKKALPKMTRNDLLNHYQKNYVTGSAVLVVCGDKKKLGNLRKMEEEYFGELKKGEREPLEKVAKETKGTIRVINKRTSQTHFAMGIRTFPLTDKRIYSGKILDIIFGHSFSSRLFQQIREKRKLAYAVFSSIDFFQDTGVFSLYEGVDQKRLEEAIKATREEMEKITINKAQGITEKELKRAKNYLSGRIAVQMDDPANQVVFYAKHFLFHKEIIEPQELIKRHEAVKKGELVEIAKDLFKPEKINLVAMGKGIDKGKLEKIIE